MGILGVFKEYKELKESVNKLADNNNSLREDISVLESTNKDLRARDAGWTTLADISGSSTDLPDDKRDKLHDRAREAFIYSPAGHRMVKYTTSYIVGRGFNIQSYNPAVQHMIDKFVKNPHNHWKRQKKEWVNRRQIDGEVFITLTIQKDGSSIVRETNPYEIRRVLYDPDDIQKPILYERVYQEIKWESAIPNEVQATEYIPYIFATKKDIDKLNMGSLSSKISKVKKIYHMKTVSFADRLRGLSDFSPVLYYLSRLKSNLDKNLKVNEIRDSYVLDVTVDGNDDEVKAEAGKPQYRRPPKAGSVFVHNDKVHIELKNPSYAPNDVGKNIEPILAQVVMGSGMPEWMLVGKANMFKAGAQEQSAPFVKSIEDLQELFEYDLINILTFVITNELESIHKNRGKFNGLEGEKAFLSQIDKNLKVPKMTADKKSGELVEEKGKDNKVIMIPFWETIDIQFPQIIERDEKKEADAVSADIANELVSRKSASMKRGYDYDQEKIYIDIERAERIYRKRFLMMNMKIWI